MIMHVICSEQGESDDSDSDSEEEGYDSDVQREKDIDYSAKTYGNPIRDTEGIKPHLQPTQPEEKYVCMSL